ncbi:MAG: hypothetical protein R2831_01730 [Chitinophagaceae bacterium]
MNCRILIIVFCFIPSLLHAQQSRFDSIRIANKNRLDSIRQANTARLDSIKAYNKAKSDSISEARKAAREKAQEERENKELLRENKRLSKLPISQEMAATYRLYNDGWGFAVQRGFIKTEDVETPHTIFLWLELSEKKHPKETKTINETFAVLYPDELKPIAYKYGKINNFYQLKLGIGNSKPFTGRLDKRSVQINWVYAAALSFGMAKPYYLDLFLPEGNGYIRTFDKYSESNATYFLDLNNQGTIIGGSYFYKGLGEIKLIPGIALRSGFYFDYAPTPKTFMGVEIGAMLEAYTRKAPIMAIAPNKAVFFSAYADFRFGKRWK